MPRIIVWLSELAQGHFSNELMARCEFDWAALVAENLFVKADQVEVVWMKPHMTLGSAAVALDIEFSTGEYGPKLPNDWDNTRLIGTLDRSLKAWQSKYNWWSTSSIWIRPIQGGRFLEVR